MPRNRLQRVSLAMIGVASCLLPLSATGYGPGTHIREAQSYVEALVDGLAPDDAQTDLALLQDEANLPFFYMGAIFPDVGRQVDGIGFEPHRLDVVRGLLELTADPTPAEEPLRAFALGNALHATSDSAAQVFLVPYLTAATDIGVVDVLVDVYDGAGGENEFFVEAVADLYVGDLHTLVDLYYRLTAWAEDPLDLRPVLIDYYLLVDELLGDLPLTPETFADNVDSLLDEISGYIGSLTPEVAHNVVENLINSHPSELFDLLVGAGAGFLGMGGVELAPDSIDRLAQDRLMAHPFVADPSVYSVYDDSFGRLGSAFLRDYYATAEVFDNWRTWHGPPLFAANIQSLSWRLPDTFAPDPDVLVWSMAFADAAGPSVTALALDALPAEIVLELVVFPSTARGAELELEVRGDRPGFDWQGDPVVAVVELSLGGLPELGAPPHRAALQARFDPSETAQNVLGYYAVLIDNHLETDGKPVLVTLDEPYLNVSGADLTLPAWERVFTSSSLWQPYLAIEAPTAIGSDVTLDIRVRNRRFLRQGVPETDLEVWRDGAKVETVVTNDVGRIIWGPSVAGSYRLVSGDADEFAWWQDTDPVATTAGQTAVVTALMEPIPRVDIYGGFSADASHVQGRVLDHRFSEVQRFESAVSATSTPPNEGWLEMSSTRIDHVIDPPADDGDAFYLFARARSEGEVVPGPVGVSSPLVVDASPPSTPEVAISHLWVAGQPIHSGSLSASDPHSGVVRFNVQIKTLGDDLLFDETLVSASPTLVELAWDDQFSASSELVLAVTAVNGAGLESDASEVEIEIVADVQSDTAPDVGDVGDNDISEEADVEESDVADALDLIADGETTDIEAATTGGDDCGCSTAVTSGQLGWILFLMLGIVILIRRPAASSVPE